MKLFRDAIYVCMQNFRNWKNDYRIWSIVIVICIFVFQYVNPITRFSKNVGEDISPWIFPFLFTNDYLQMIIFIGVIVILCDAPFVNENQPYIIVRSGRKAWCVGQVLYIILVSVIYILFLFLISILFCITNIKFQWDWGKLFGTLAYTDAAQIFKLNVNVDSILLTYFTPLQAMWFTFLLTLLAMIFIGLFIYVINILSNTRIIGTVISIFFVLLDRYIVEFEYAYWAFASPLTWKRLTYIDIGGISNRPTIVYILVAYFTVITALIITVVLVSKKKSIKVLPPI